VLLHASIFQAVAGLTTNAPSQSERPVLWVDICTHSTSSFRTWMHEHEQPNQGGTDCSKILGVLSPNRCRPSLLDLFHVVLVRDLASQYLHDGRYFRVIWFFECLAERGGEKASGLRLD